MFVNVNVFVHNHFMSLHSHRGRCGGMLSFRGGVVVFSKTISMSFRRHSKVFSVLR